MGQRRGGVDLSAVEQAYQIAEKALEIGNDSAEYSRYNQAFHMGIWEADNEKMEIASLSMWNGLSMGHKVTEEDYAKISSTSTRRFSTP